MRIPLALLVEDSARDKHEFGDVVPGDLDAFLALEAQAAFLQDADRADVVLCRVRVERTLVPMDTAR